MEQIDMSRTHFGWSRITPAVLVAAALTGCAGHGTYTTAFKEEAEDRMDRMKAATQWDMAHQQFLSGDLDKAQKTIDGSIAIVEDVSKSHLLRGRIMFEKGRLESALSSFNRAIELDEKSTEAFYYRGMVYERFSQPVEALENYSAAEKLDPANPQYVLASAEMLIAMDRLDEAKSLLTESARDFKHNAGVRQTLGHIAMMEGRIDDAVVLFQEASRLAPDEDGLVEDLAGAQIAAGRYADAETNIRRLVSKDKDGRRRDLRQLQARCLIELDRPVEARSLLMQLVADDEGQSDVGAWTQLGSIAIILNDDRRLRECANRLIAIAPDRHEGYLLLATWQRGRGNVKGAVASLDKAIERSMGDPEPALLQGIIYADMGQQQQALRSFQTAQSLDPSDPRATAMIRRLSSGARLTNVPVSE